MTTLEHLITIVVPCKNEENYIGHLLTHLKRQKAIGNTKIYIADGQSTDNTLERIEANKGDLNVEVIEGGPVSTAKNNGARLAKTPYILFIDADVRFFSNRILADSVSDMQMYDYHLIGAKAKCYDNDIRAKIGFTLFNVINSFMAHFCPFAVGAFMLTRRDKFEQYGGFPDKYATSEDFFLSRMYDPKHFKIQNHYFGQDSRRFQKMGYFGMAYYLIQNFLNRNNEEYWKNISATRYWD